MKEDDLGTEYTEDDKEKTVIPQVLPLLPLRDLVVFPHMIVPLFIGRSKSVTSIDYAMEHGRFLLLGTQKNIDSDKPKPRDVYRVGTVAEIMQLLKLPDGTVKALVEGKARVAIQRFLETDSVVLVKVKQLDDKPDNSVETQALVRNVINHFEEYIKLNRKIPLEIMMVILNTEDPSRLADIVTAHLQLPVLVKQDVLEAVNIKSRLKKLVELMSREIEILSLEKKIDGSVRKQMDKINREYYLREQIKAIQKELGYDEEMAAEVEEYREKIENTALSAEALEKASSQLMKLMKMPPGVPESTVTRNYLDWILDLPWGTKTTDCEDLKRSARILNGDHYGLEEIKERILEFLAVKTLTKKLKGPILCLVGPPGVGKTSVGRSIARALDRNFVRMSLGGIRDEAEIRGHRRTYIGSLPGRILQLMKKAGTVNPLFLLDEVDKMASDFRGDPASALLEVLDPEQNNAFNDHYLSLPYDLSDVMFITTANYIEGIPHALRDRMEVLRLPGYTEEEKYEIAKRHLVPKQLKANGLKKSQIKLEKSAIVEIIRFYTREAGVRNLEREISAVLRKVATNIVKKGAGKTDDSINDVGLTTINDTDIEGFLGPKKFRQGLPSTEKEPGIAYGLAWTEAGGCLLPIECAQVPGKGKFELTGQLGDIMKESAKAAYTYTRSRAHFFDITSEVFEKNDIHIHVPEGAIPKDGPSAGITMTVALLSMLTKRPCRNDTAMTGEITLTGRVLPVGGIREKLLSAHRAGIYRVLLPDDNRKDIIKVPKEVLKKMEIIFVDHVDRVIQEVLIPETGKKQKDQKANKSKARSKIEKAKR